MNGSSAEGRLACTLAAGLTARLKPCPFKTPEQTFVDRLGESMELAAAALFFCFALSAYAEDCHAVLGHQSADVASLRRVEDKWNDAFMPLLIRSVP